MFTRNLSKRSSRGPECVFCISLVCVMFSSAALSQPWTKASVTFTQPMEIPGAGAQVLPAGTYVFRLLDSLSDRHIVQVFSQDEAHIYATILAIANHRLQSTGQMVMTFAEASAGSPPVVRAWFYPRDNWGQEFVYPKARAVELAKRSKQPVLYMATELAPAVIAPV